VEEQESKILALKAGVKWREEGEKSTKYFLSLFKSRQERLQLRSLRDAAGNVYSTVASMIPYVKQFYQDLYKKDNLESNMPDTFFNSCPRLDPAKARMLANPLTVEELKGALSSCKESTPGLDGIPYSYYKKFSNELLPLLLSSWEFAQLSGSLTHSHRKSCITLLPKEGKDLELINNWRPISLSPCDLKIITKAYADRLKMILPDLIHEAQAAYVPGRDIAFNNRLLSFAKSRCHKDNLDYCIVSLDARKAFDSVSHSYLSKVLEVYGFPEEFNKVFKLLYKEQVSVVQVNGFLTDSVSIQKGVKQGDALSCGLFILAIDPLIRNIVEDPNIIRTLSSS